MAQNVGTTVTAPIVKNDSNDQYAAINTASVQGGPKNGFTLSALYAVGLYEREWGMIGVVAAIGAYVTYQLTEGYVDSNIMNNANWKVFAVGGSVTINTSAEIPDFLGPLTTDASVTPPAAGAYKDVTYNLAGDINPLTGIMATGSGKKYVIQNIPADPDAFPTVYIPNVNGSTYALVAKNFVILIDHAINDFRVVRI